MHSSGMRTSRLLTISQHALGRGGVSQHALDRGCLPRGVSGQGGVWLRWGVWPRGGCLAKKGVSGQGECLARGMSARGGVCPGVCVADIPLNQRQTPPPCEQNDSQTGVKTLPCRNFVAGGKHSPMLIIQKPCKAVFIRLRKVHTQYIHFFEKRKHGFQVHRPFIIVQSCKV